MFNQMNINVNAPNEKLNIEIRLVDKHFEYSFSRITGLYTYHSGSVDEKKSQEWLQEIKQSSLADWPVLPNDAGPEIKQKNKWNVEKDIRNMQEEFKETEGELGKTEFKKNIIILNRESNKKLGSLLK